jgi:hypothetical protein
MCIIQERKDVPQIKPIEQQQQQQPQQQRNDNREELDFLFDEDLPRRTNLLPLLPTTTRRRTTSLTLDMTDAQ